MDRNLCDLLSVSNPFILTPWTSGFGEDPCKHFQLTPEQAAARDVLYRVMVLSILIEHDHNMVMSMLDAGAKAFAMPGVFYIGFPSMEFIQVPEISQKLVLLPWVEPYETAH